MTHRVIQRAAWMLCASTVVAIVSGCGWIGAGKKPGSSLPYAMAPVLRAHSAMQDAVTSYSNACGVQAPIATGKPLVGSVEQALGRMFQSVAPVTDGPTDGIIDIALVTQRIVIEAAKSGTGLTQAKVTLGLDLSYATAKGVPLYTKTIERSSQGPVERQEGACQWIGLERLVAQAAELVASTAVQPMGASAEVRDFAESKPSRPVLPAPSREGETKTVASSHESPTSRSSVTQMPAQTVPVSGDRLPGHVTFRAILRDSSRDQVVQPDEDLLIEIEVQNDGPSEVQGVDILVSGSGVLTGALPPVISMGTLKPGERKRTILTKPVAAITEPLQGEVMLSLRTVTPLAEIPPTKKFVMWVKLAGAPAGPASIDLDQPPKSMPVFKQSKAVVVAIGVGRFRDEQVPPVPYAGRDAESVAAALQALTGTSPDHVRVLRDSHAMKQDVSEVVEQWLPQKVEATSTVYLFYAGRGLVNMTTGAVALVPFDGTTASVARPYPLKRLQEMLSKLPMQRAMVMLDLSLEPEPGTGATLSGGPVWETGSSTGEAKIMWMIGNQALQDAHAHEPSKHGLFTMALLKGLHGVADLDRDGTVVAGELCTFARGEVGRLAREQFGNGQEPVCVPPVGQGALIRRHALAPGHNPKPVAVEKLAPAAPSAAKPAAVPRVGP